MQKLRRRSFEKMNIHIRRVVSHELDVWDFILSRLMKGARPYSLCALFI
jgi:hypothetical protein